MPSSDPISSRSPPPNFPDTSSEPDLTCNKSDQPVVFTSDQIKCETVWIPDGDVVLRAENTLFRVQKEYLREHSPIFDDLFRIPLPDVLDKDDSYEGCPVIQLFDPADHLQHFLSGLYNTSYMISVVDNRTLRIAVGMLELSTKYETYELRERAISFLSVIFPDTLLGYQERWDRWSKDPKEAPHPNNIALVANVARITKALSLLPSALFHYLERFGHDLGTIVDAHDAGIALGSENYEADLPLLIKDNLSSILKGRSRIIFSTRKEVFGFAFYGYKYAECADGNTVFCQQNRYRWVEKQDVQSPDGWLSPVSQDIETVQLCSGCSPAVTKVYKHSLATFWDRLPEMFDLVEWKELQRSSRLV